MAQAHQTSYHKLYYPKNTPRQTLGIILIVLGAILLLAYGLGLILLVPGILVYYYGREQCPSCNARDCRDARYRYRHIWLEAWPLTSKAR